MIKVKDGKLQAELLDNKGTLSNKIVSSCYVSRGIEI